MHYKHILAAIDLSPRSQEVIDRAAEVAASNNATLDVVHVIEHSPVAYGGEFSIPINVNLEQTIESEARKALTELCHTVKVPSERQHTLSGVVKHMVIELAEKLNIDLIVVGTHGHHGLDKLLGSRANAILHLATCDVLAVWMKE
ncbi:universal stress protein [Coxiella burnetii]|uniref:universal stress protein n=1 Tax=Coxiella burnetii TaxID=777 RepID=UPI000183CE5B|nr:universal stress protein [Coxiella burnetii]ACJ19232.1 universal stress protein A [Coxiella burnetii CbuG_Q212]OYK85446.1 universal stress protein A [Coxiella burnetii]